MITVLSDIRQRHVEAFFKAMRGVKQAELFSPEYAGAVVRAAAAAGVLVGLSVEQVDDLHPGECVKLSGQVSDAVGESLTIPPN